MTGEGNTAGRGRVGLQLKVALILTLVVIGVTAVGGWFYFDSARRSLRASDRQHAGRMVQALGMAAQYDLRQGHALPLQRLAGDFVRNENVLYVALVDGNAMLVASASADADPDRWAWLLRLPVSVSTNQRVGADALALARPIVMRDVIWYDQRLVGSARIVFDTRATTAKLALVQSRIIVVAAVIVLLGLPLGYLLVWQVMLKPIRGLLSATRKLAGGDFAARADIRRADEIGQLGGAFDAMAGDLAQMRDELLEANEQLERKVAERTEALRLANGRLRDEMVEKEQFLRAVGHDLNAPLRNVAGMATMIMMKWSDELPEEVVARLQRIQANIDVETSLIGELLELSRIRTRPQRRQVVDVGRLVAELARTFEYELKSRRIELTADDEMPRLYVEESRIRQVLQNLIDNAIKYMHRDEGGAIHVGYRRDGRLHVLSVADNGPGIPADQQERIFCIFRRAESAAAGNVAGKGVGLALVRSVVANYHGRAWVESAGGRGATFHVALDAENTAKPADRPAGTQSDVHGNEAKLQADHDPARR